MLCFDIRSLAEKAVQVDGRLAADDAVWEEADVRPNDAVHVTGRLSTAGNDRFYFSGRLQGEVTTECRRCLTDVSSDVDDEIHLIFADADDEEAEDPDVHRIDPRAHELDLRPAIREHWLLAVPAFALCREDCKGLCPTCGADLNSGACSCAPATDSRWDALRTVRDDAP
jgi:uncharacterized protein